MQHRSRPTRLKLTRPSSQAKRGSNGGGGGGGSGGGGGGGSESDSEEEGVVLVEQSAYCFRKMVAQLQLIAMAPLGEPPPPPLVAEHERHNFSKLVELYFSGREQRILTQGVHRPLGCPPNKTSS